jgi:hypothetical protein
MLGDIKEQPGGFFGYSGLCHGKTIKAHMPATKMLKHRMER